MTRPPTARELEAFRLRCQGLTYPAVAAALGISRPTAQLAATSAARKLIRSKASAGNAFDRAAALVLFPKLAERLRQPPPATKKPAAGDPATGKSFQGGNGATTEGDAVTLCAITRPA